VCGVYCAVGAYGQDAEFGGFYVEYCAYYGVIVSILAFCAFVSAADASD